MTVKLLSEQHLEFLIYTGSSESTHVRYHIVGDHMSRLICNWDNAQTTYQRHVPFAALYLWRRHYRKSAHDSIWIFFSNFAN